MLGALSTAVLGYKIDVSTAQKTPMAERTTAKEVSIDLAGFKTSVDKQFVLSFKLIFGLYTLLGAIIGGGFLLRGDLADSKAQIAKSGAELRHCGAS